jgi:hypothetical protein
MGKQDVKELIKDVTLNDYAKELLQGEPLYASVDGITNIEAMELALVLFPDVSDWHNMLEG